MITYIPNNTYSLDGVLHRITSEIFCADRGANKDTRDKTLIIRSDSITSISIFRRVESIKILSPSVKDIYIMPSGAEELDFTNCPELETLDISGSRVKSLDLSNNPKLEDLSVNNSKELQTLDVSSNRELKVLKSYCMPELRSITGLPKGLQEFYFHTCPKLSPPDLSELNSLTHICSSNQRIPHFKVESKELVSVYAGDTQSESFWLRSDNLETIYLEKPSVIDLAIFTFTSSKEYPGNIFDVYESEGPSLAPNLQTFRSNCPYISSNFLKYLARVSIL